MTHLTKTEIGALIERLGNAVATGTTTHEQAVTELLAATPPGHLHRQGAIGQLACWRTARSRYREDTTPAATSPRDARDLRARTDIVFRFPAKQQA